MCEYGFSAGVDYSPFLTNRSDGLPGKPKQDAALTIDMAKEICMLQRNERGKQARQYFIQLEKDWNNPDMVIARALKLADSKIMMLEGTVDALNKENDLLAEKVLKWADRKFIEASVRKYASSACDGNFGAAWVALKKEVLYRHSINLNSRITKYLNETGKK